MLKIIKTMTEDKVFISPVFQEDEEELSSEESEDESWDEGETE